VETGGDEAAAESVRTDDSPDVALDRPSRLTGVCLAPLRALALDEQAIHRPGATEARAGLVRLHDGREADARVRDHPIGLSRAEHLAQEEASVRLLGREPSVVLASTLQRSVCPNAVHHVQERARGDAHEPSARSGADTL
jgi:hypothetical protein